MTWLLLFKYKHLISANSRYLDSIKKAEEDSQWWFKEEGKSRRYCRPFQCTFCLDWKSQFSTLLSPRSFTSIKGKHQVIRWVSMRHVLFPGNPSKATHTERVAPSACKNHLYTSNITF